MLVAGIGPDCLFNTIFFLLGVIPGHIHGYYVTLTYFHRKGKVRKGKYPGGPKSFICSELVWNGGASNRRVEELRQKEEDERMAKEMEKAGIKKWRSRKESNVSSAGRSANQARRGEVQRMKSDVGVGRTGPGAGRGRGVKRSRTMM
ncbi:hypothetical protein ACMFMG_010003 [Clarireedia jacksonii]